MSRISFRDFSISYEVRGCGKDIVVLPGFWTNSDWMGRYLDLANQGKIWIINPPYSSLSETSHKHSLKDYTDSTIAIFERLGIRKPIIIAESFGCALALGMEKQIQAEKLVLIAPLPYLPITLFIQAAFSMLLPNRYVIRQRAKKMCKRTPELFEKAVAMMSGFGKSKLWGSVMAMKDFVASKYKPKCPTLIIGGFFDKIATPEKLENLSKIFDAKLVINKNSGHHVSEHAWPECKAYIEEFMGD